MRNAERGIVKWVSRMLSEGDGTPSTKRVCFFAAIVVTLVLVVDQFSVRGLEPNVLQLANSILITCGAAYGISRFAEYGGSSAPPLDANNTVRGAAGPPVR